LVRTGLTRLDTTDRDKFSLSEELPLAFGLVTIEVLHKSTHEAGTEGDGNSPWSDPMIESYSRWNLRLVGYR
jgi:hypothetical protein